MVRNQLSDQVLILFGVCVWDFVTSLWFEYRLLTKKIRFRWPFVPYFLARYSVLAYATMNATGVFIDFKTLPLCAHAAFITSILSIGLLGVVFSAWNLLTRTIIIWGYHPVVMKLLLATGLVHFVLSLVVSFIGRPSCTPLPPSVVIVTVYGATTAIIEFGILVLSLVGIRRASLHGESHLARLLKSQGAVYFVMVFLLHVAVIITSVRIGVSTGISVGISSTILAPVLSCRLVTSTLSQNSHTDCNPKTRMHRIERLELSGDQGQNPTGHITTCIDITDVTKDQGVC